MTDKITQPARIWAVFEKHEQGGLPRTYATAEKTNGTEYVLATQLQEALDRAEKAEAERAYKVETLECQIIELTMIREALEERLATSHNDALEKAARQLRVMKSRTSGSAVTVIGNCMAAIRALKTKEAKGNG